jgi:AcrR family transcriptional regulator
MQECGSGGNAWQVGGSVRGHEGHRGHGDHQGHREDRRSERARRAILNAADDLLVEVGYAGVTIEGIAARAGVGKQTIYRWWGSKADVLMDNFSMDASEELALPDLGSVDADLRIYLRRLAQFVTGSPAGAVLVALIGQAQHDHAMAATFRGDHLTVLRNRERILLRRGIERGELPPDLDVDAALAELLGPVYYRVLVTGEPVDSEFTDQLVDRFVARAETRG